MDYDFSFFLVVASLVTGIIWGSYVLFLKISKNNSLDQAEPFLIETARSLFPVLFLVLFLRSFVAEPFRIPSGSMMPTLLIGDFILVNKFTYGIRLPILHTKIVEIGKPETGDVVVFRFPQNPKVDYIKRVVGLPGDRVAYYNKKIYVNGKLAKQASLGQYYGVGQGENMTGAEHSIEYLMGVEHSILIKQGLPSVEGVFVVPEGHYFVMGDNRDSSNDSRYWGTVPERNLVGKAFFIWMSWDWQHEGIGLDRIGTILK
ncbi:MAG: signal peptidase I [Methylococcales symbiont of Iophon sp. n. MRB-2018]|nr:MAG: signal peptidase I [Methylococcales symbiont of Iophon sp. n. MRB-2018]KAF3979792.1 MAG: signal peptidase I [Methylococcales symbiont of Iophon sp. n. MRB-2018]